MVRTLSEIQEYMHDRREYNQSDQMETQGGCKLDSLAYHLRNSL